MEKGRENENLLTAFYLFALFTATWGTALLGCTSLLPGQTIWLGGSLLSMSESMDRKEQTVQYQAPTLVTDVSGRWRRKMVAWGRQTRLDTRAKLDDSMRVVYHPYELWPKPHAYR